MRGRLRWLASLALLAAFTAGCGGRPEAEPVSFLAPADPEAKKVEEVVRAYYDAVRQDDVEAQVGLWSPSRRDEALLQAKAWTKRGKEGLTLAAFHVMDAEEPGQRVAHYYILLTDQSLPEGKAALLEDVGGAWRIRELR